MTVASPFKPARGQNQKVSATTTSATATIGKGQRSLRVVNVGAQVAYFRCYLAGDGSGTTASAADTPVAAAGAAGSVIIIEKQPEFDTVAYVADSATTTLNFQPGEGGC